MRQGWGWWAAGSNPRAAALPWASPCLGHASLTRRLQHQRCGAQYRRQRAPCRRPARRRRRSCGMLRLHPPSAAF